MELNFRNQKLKEKKFEITKINKLNLENKKIEQEI